MGALDGRVSELEHWSGDQADGPVLIWIDGCDPRATDEAPPGEMPRMFATRAGAERWLAREGPKLPPTPEGQIAVVYIDQNGDKTAAEIKAGLRERTRRAEAHAESLAQQQREIAEELAESRERRSATY